MVSNTHIVEFDFKINCVDSISPIDHITDFVVFNASCLNVECRRETVQVLSGWLSDDYNHRSSTPKFVTPTALSCNDNSWRSTTLSPSTIIYVRWSSRRYELGCDTPVITTRVLNMIFYMLSSLIGEGLGTSCREICRSTFCAILACYQHRAILNVRWRELWPLRKDALVKSCGAKDSTGELIGWGVGTVVKRCTFHWLISNDTCIAQKEMVLDSLIIHHLIMITCISYEIISSISLSKFW